MEVRDDKDLESADLGDWLYVVWEVECERDPGISRVLDWVMLIFPEM